ncbi:MAG: hypothetical protein IK093_08865 [Ruminiclostridium sp.]|nr:hypothetical protein [Ruminiclostridium sp.]
MICRTVDRITADHKPAADYCRKRILTFFDTSDGRNIAVFIISGVAAGIFAGIPNDIIRYASFAITVAVWIQTSVLAGFLRQWLYIFFAAVWFMLPYVFVIKPDTAEAAQASDIQYMISDLLQAVPLRPMYMIAGEGDPGIVSAIVLLVCIVLFFIGFRARTRAKRSDFYCRTRLEQLK